MTEHNITPEAYEEYLSARDRTAHWVQAHSSQSVEFYSPSVQPTPLDGWVPPSPSSDAGSSYSVPPKMVLKWGDGRPDVPVPIINVPLSSRRRHHDMNNPSQRSHATSSSTQTSSPIPIQQSFQVVDQAASSPEEIRVFPSHAPVGPLPSHSGTDVHALHQVSQHIRSKSIPWSATNLHTSRNGPEHINVAPLHSRPNIHPRNASHGGGQANYVGQGSSGTWHAHPLAGSAKHLHGQRPPAIVYAPGSHHGRAPHYTPPAILHHAPQRGHNRVVYSHSAPVPLEGGAYPAPLDDDDLERLRKRDRTRSMGPGVVHKVPRSNVGENSDGESVRSGSTYYVLPASGQKVHVIAPSPGESVVTATSTTKSPGPSPRKPFFQRLFGFAKIGSASVDSSRGNGRKLRRRHSTGNSGRSKAIRVPPTPEPEMVE